MKISHIYSTYELLLNNTIQIQGWVLTSRQQKDIIFVKINDGTHPNGLQLIIENAIDFKLNMGISVSVNGILVKSPAEGQLFELKVQDIKLLGECDPDTYPLCKAKMGLDYLRNFNHLRFRTSTFGSVFRIKSAISTATHMFFSTNDYLHLDPNIITQNECEGGAGVFQITEKDISIPSNLQTTKTGHYDWSLDHFNKPVYLTVSSQLQLEAMACALGSVYTTNKSFRSEHSSTNKHLSEFTHLEIETCFIELDDLMSIGEKYIKFVAKYVLRYCLPDIENLNKFVSKGLKDRIKTVIDCKFNKIEYKEAIRVAQEHGKLIKYGEDLSTEIENCLTEHYNGPVFVYNWPISIKSFYMKQDLIDPLLCNNFDLLMPYKIGELIGGSMREDNYTKLLSMMKQKGVSEHLMTFYTDLRKYGSVPHGGFGLGFDRMTMLFTGMENIKDTVPFPIYYKNCDF
jgi:asparaginyl-tRNA synthetase